MCTAKAVEEMDPTSQSWKRWTPQTTTISRSRTVFTLPPKHKASKKDKRSWFGTASLQQKSKQNAKVAALFPRLGEILRIQCNKNSCPTKKVRRNGQSCGRFLLESRLRFFHRPIFCFGSSKESNFNWLYSRNWCYFAWGKYTIFRSQRPRKATTLWGRNQLKCAKKIVRAFLARTLDVLLRSHREIIIWPGKDPALAETTLAAK